MQLLTIFWFGIRKEQQQNDDHESPKSITLAGPRPARNLLETCSLAGLRLACVRDRVALSKVHHASKSEDLFARMNPIDLT